MLATISCGCAPPGRIASPPPYPPPRWRGRVGRGLHDRDRTTLMPQFSTRRRVKHSAADMFDLVADIERYPEFVPLCRSLKVRKRISEPEGIEVLVADMTIAY